MSDDCPDSMTQALVQLNSGMVSRVGLWAEQSGYQKVETQNSLTASVGRYLRLSLDPKYFMKWILYIYISHLDGSCSSAGLTA